MIPLTKYLKKKNGVRKWVGPKRIIILTAFVSAMLWVWWNSHNNGTLGPAIIAQYLNEHPIGSVALFLLVYAISVIAALPSLPLNLAAGFFWGGLLGGVYASAGVTLGGWVSFVIARRIFGQPLTEEFNNKWVVKVREEFERNKWKFVAFARINPIIPTGPLNYLLGLTSLSNRDFLWVTFIFLLPPSMVVSYVGDALQTFTANQGNVREVIQSVIIASGAFTILVLIKFAFKIINKKSDPT